MKCAEGSIKNNELAWIRVKILKGFYDKDFRSDTIESLLCEMLLPTEFTMKDKVQHWVRVCSGFDQDVVKALAKILVQKQRLQQEMQRYLFLTQLYQVRKMLEIRKLWPTTTV